MLRFGRDTNNAQGFRWLWIAVLLWILGVALLPCRPPAVTDAVLVGGMILPHGDFALDPTFFEPGTIERSTADLVALRSRRAARWLSEQQRKHPDEPLVVLLTTPHGLKLDYDYGIYISSRGSGTATIGGDCRQSRKRIFIRKSLDATDSYSDTYSYGDSYGYGDSDNDCQRQSYNLTLRDVPLAPTALAEDLLETLHRDKGHPVSGIYSYDADAPIPLNWGEIVPLSIVRNVSDARSAPPLLPLIWTFPERRYDHAVDMVPELLDTGADIAEWIRNRPEAVAVLVSGDLSHTHRASGPYGYSDASARYDGSVGRWASQPCHPKATAELLERARALQPDAKSCGFTGFVLWHGIMCSLSNGASMGGTTTLSSSSSSTTTTPRSVSSQPKAHADNSTGSSSNDHGSNGGSNTDRVMKFSSTVFVNRNVTYYGMMAATFTPEEELVSKSVQ